MIRDILNDAYDEIKESRLPKELWGEALPSVIRLAATERGNLPVTPEIEGNARSHENGWSTALGRRLRIDPEPLQELFEVDASGVRLLVSPSRLPESRAAATRMVALLIAGARQGAELDDGWTPVSVVRDVCREYGVLDSANFASEVASMDAFAFRGSGASREIKVTARGFEQTAEQVRILSRP